MVLKYEIVLWKCGRECSSHKILSLVDEIIYQSVWWINGFISGTFGTSVPHVGQLVHKRLVTIVDTMVDEASTFILWQEAQSRYGFVNVE